MNEFDNDKNRELNGNEVVGAAGSEPVGVKDGDFADNAQHIGGDASATAQEKPSGEPPAFKIPTYEPPVTADAQASFEPQPAAQPNFAQVDAARSAGAPQTDAGFDTRSFTPPQSAQSKEPQPSPSVPPIGGYNCPPDGQYAAYSQNPSPNAAQNPFAAAPEKRSGKRGFRVFCALLAVVILLSVGVGVGYIAGGNRDLRGDTSRNDLSGGDSVVIQQGTVPQKDDIKPDASGKYAADDVAQLVADSVVNITVYSEGQSTSAIASGVIIDKAGHILTNDHIYADIPAAKFAVTLHNGKSYAASFVAGDARSDLAVLKISDAKAESLTPAVFADSSKLRAGEEVIAIGSPYGLTGTVTKGIVSAPSRRISSSASNGSGSYSMRVIQTDTAINSGNSGGALVNMYGQVVGISSSKIVLSGYEGLCFAIPSNDSVKTAKSLIAHKKVVGRAKLGITYTEISAASALVNNVPAGLMIQSINMDSNLYSAGLSKGDIITEVNGKQITAASVALDIIDDSAASDKLTLKVYIASTKQYKTVSAVLLEDDSVSSYRTEAEQTTAQPFTFR